MIATAVTSTHQKKQFHQSSWRATVEPIRVCFFGCGCSCVGSACHLSPPISAEGYRLTRQPASNRLTPQLVFSLLFPPFFLCLLPDTNHHHHYHHTPHILTHTHTQVNNTLALVIGETWHRVVHNKRRDSLRTVLFTPSQLSTITNNIYIYRRINKPINQFQLLVSLLLFV